MRRCFFIGHRDASEEIFPALFSAIEHHITYYGVREFVVGHHGRFDAMVAQCLVEIKKSHPDICLTQLMVYHPSNRSIAIWEGFDGSMYLDGLERVPKHLAIVKANRKMIHQSEYLIAYVWQAASNARKLMEYAERKGICITNLANYKKREDALE